MPTFRYKAYSATTGPHKAGTEAYALGWTHHSVGSQNIRTMSIIQLLLGNMGIAGGDMFAGSNAAYAHPVLFRRIEAARAANIGRSALMARIMIAELRRRRVLGDLHSD